MPAIGRKEKEMMDHLESIVHRFVFTTKHPGMDVCRKGEVTIVEILGRNGCMIMSEIADYARLSLSTATGLVDGMVAKGLVTRERCDEDRRIVRVSLTEEGEKIYQQALETRLGVVRGMLGALDRQEQQALVELFRKISEKIEAEKKRTIA